MLYTRTYIMTEKRNESLQTVNEKFYMSILS